MSGLSRTENAEQLERLRKQALALDSPLRHVLGVTLDFMVNVLKNGGGDKKGLQSALDSFNKAREAAKAWDILRSKPLHQILYGIAGGIEALGQMISEEKQRAEETKEAESPPMSSIKAEPTTEPPAPARKKRDRVALDEQWARENLPTRMDRKDRPSCYGSAIPKELYDYPDDPSATLQQLQQLQQTQRVIARLLPKASDDSPAPPCPLTEEKVLTDAIDAPPQPTIPSSMHSIPTVPAASIDANVHSNDDCGPILTSPILPNPAVHTTSTDAPGMPTVALELTTHASSISFQEATPSSTSMENVFPSATLSFETMISTRFSTTVIAPVGAVETPESPAALSPSSAFPDTAALAAAIGAAAAAAAAEVEVEIVFYLGSAAAKGAAALPSSRKRKHSTGRQAFGQSSDEELFLYSDDEDYDMPKWRMKRGPVKRPRLLSSSSSFSSTSSSTSTSTSTTGRRQSDKGSSKRNASRSTAKRRLINPLERRIMAFIKWGYSDDEDYGSDQWMYNISDDYHFTDDEDDNYETAWWTRERIGDTSVTATG